MQVSYKWLQDYLDLDITAEQLADVLTNGGVEVEGIIDMNPGIDDVVVGEVLEVTPHPQADKLSLTKVNVGEAADQELQIVCGASNVEAGQKVPVALVGTQLPDGMKIKKTKLRGELSQGMICSCDELQLMAPQGEDGIMVLDQNAPIGVSIVEYLELDDKVLEFDLTPNRADCLGMIGVANEIAALLDIPVKYPQVTDYKQNKILEEIDVNIEDSNLCDRYIATLVTDIEIGESPLWLQQRLRSAGIRPINNLVDITNYVMIEYGQPLHAFDYDLIHGNEMCVRLAQQGETIVTLDEKERHLTNNDLLIADREKGIAIAGVMGGFNTEVTDHTQKMLLEAASFNNVSVRRTANRLNLRSDASLRFEKGIDPNKTLEAANRALELIEQLGVGIVVVGAADEYPSESGAETIELRTARARNLTGIDISDEEMTDIFRRLNFQVKGSSNRQGEQVLQVEVPTSRNDINLEVDLIEEVARMYGYDQIPTTMPKGELTQGRKTHFQQVVDVTRESILSAGFSEIISYTFISPDDYDRVKFDSDDKHRESIPLANPMTREQSVMRTTMLPSFLKTLEHNSNHGEKDLQIFEIGKVYYPKQLPLKELPEEQTTLMFGGMGKTTPQNWIETPEKIDYFHVKGILELLLDRLNIPWEEVQIRPTEHPSFHPTRTAEVFLSNNKLGIMGEVHPEISEEEYDLDHRVVVAELNLEPIIEQAELTEAYEPLPKFPAVLRDIAILVSEDVSEQQVVQVITQEGGKIIEDITLFDLYQGERIPEGMKSLAYSLKFRDPDTTLTDERVDEVFHQIENKFEQILDAQIRKS